MFKVIREFGIYLKFCLCIIYFYNIPHIIIQLKKTWQFASYKTTLQTLNHYLKKINLIQKYN